MHARMINPLIDRREYHDKHVFFVALPETQGSVPPEWCREMHGRGQGYLRSRPCLCRNMIFETDPAMSRSAICCLPMAASISWWSPCLTFRWTHPQLSGSRSHGSPTFWGPAFDRCSSRCAPFRIKRPPALSPAQKDEVRWMLDTEGRPLAEIARLFRVSVKTIRRA